MTAIRTGFRRQWLLLLLPIIAMLLSTAVVDAKDNSKSNGTVHTFFESPGVLADPQVDTGKATLKRKKNHIEGKIKTKDLTPGAYTVWWIIFNDPSACIDGCDGSDLRDSEGVPNPGTSVAFASGKVVKKNGKGNFRAKLKVGDNSGALFGPGLTNLSGAEIHMVIRYHGPKVKAFMPAQINSFGGGCIGFGGDFACYDPQAVGFPTP